jgi:hypothetical protein
MSYVEILICWFIRSRKQVKYETLRSSHTKCAVRDKNVAEVKGTNLYQASKPVTSGMISRTYI